MPLDVPETGWQWHHVPLREALDVVVVGEVHSWWAHWTGYSSGRGNRAVRCLGREGLPCAWCAARQSPACRYVVPVWVADYHPETREVSYSEPRLVELGKPQYSMLALLDKEGGLIGRRLRLVRERPQRNAVIQVRPLGRVRVSDEVQVDVAEYVRGLGRPELAVCRPPAAADGVARELAGDRQRARDNRTVGGGRNGTRGASAAEDRALEIEWGLPSGAEPSD